MSFMAPPPNMLVFDRVVAAEKYFTDTSYGKVVKNIVSSWDANNISEVETLLDTLPDKRGLLRKLIKKLEGKSVYKTLVKIEEGKIEKSSGFLKGYTSLMTHVIIEMEHNHKEYGLLLPLLYEKIGEQLYNA